MRRATLLLAVLLALAPALAEAQSLKGVWWGTMQATINGPGDIEVVEFTRPRILIYTDAYFAWSFPGEGEVPTGDSDGEIADWARQYNTASGTYIRDGADIIYNRRTSLAPNGFGPANQPLVRRIRTLTATQLATEVTNADGVTVVLVYERVE